ncbi:MAG: redox-regulated ATPase YchF [Candidatus Lambdaproteobacteria bacterium]|nr:redox-regulated ATPase YchF [Candidatus Lambdaproteobacteria bacterium]
MNVGIVGLPGAGKTTIFNALTGLRADTGYGGKGRDHMGTIKVPDPRVDTLTAMHESKRSVYAEIVFTDAVGRPEGSRPGGGLDPQVIQGMQGCDALVVVLRAFANPALAEAPEPLRDRSRFLTELILSDLGPLENRRRRIEKEAGRSREKALLERCIAHLEAERPISSLTLNEEERGQLAGFGLLSAKPLLYLLNQEEAEFPQGVPAPLQAAAQAEGYTLMGISAKIEMDIAELEPAEQIEFLRPLGVEQSARDRFVRSAYAMLDLISFLTTGKDESRAWPIRRGTTAQKAAGKIHSDIERGFIRAEVIAYDSLVALGGEKQARDAGKLRLEGKEYLVKDGDVITFRFNV